MMDKFIEHAVKTFQTLKWKPAAPDTLSKPGLVVWGNLDSNGFGSHCVIDIQSKLLKVQVKVRSNSELLEVKFVGHYDNPVVATAMFEKYMDLAGASLHEFCRNPL